MPRLRKAWEVRPEWADAGDIFHAETAEEARQRAMRSLSEFFPDTKPEELRVRRAEHADIRLPDEHRLVAELTERQRSMIAHAYCSRSREPGYRTHYCTHPGNLDALRLAFEFGIFHGPYDEAPYGDTSTRAGAFFYLTELGQEVARSMLPTYPS